MKLEHRRLLGTHVWLDPATEADRGELRDVLQSDPENWKLQTVSAMGEHFDAYWQMMLDTPGRMTFTVRDKAEERIVGTSSFIQIDRAHRTLEIGYTFYRPEYRGTFVNPETKLLMLTEAFGAGAHRVQFSVSAANARSQAAMLKLGAQKEGMIRRHRITWTGERRDTVLFSIIDDEWDEVRTKLIARLHS